MKVDTYILWEWKNFCLKVILYTDYVQYYVTQVRNFDTCLSKSEKKKSNICQKYKYSLTQF